MGPLCRAAPLRLTHKYVDSTIFTSYRARIPADGVPKMRYAPTRSVPLLAPFILALPIALSACGGGGGTFTPAPTYTVSVSPQPASIPVNGTQVFTATTTPAGGQVFWGIVDEGPGVNLGSPTNQIGRATFTYTAPPTPPAFEGTLTPAGSVAVRASIVSGNTVQFNVVITAPSITTGFLSPFNTVALGKSILVWAYAVGSASNAITMQVNGATGGSATYGTITPVLNGFYGEYTYTAPATMPVTGSTVTVTVISQADPTKTSNLTVTLM